MKKIWMVMLFGIMLLMAKSNNVYAETYETDLSQYNVGDNILQTTFEINTDEECEYEIVESGTFHNGHAVVMMKERSDEEADEESGDEELFLGYINDKLELRCNLTEMFGCDTEQNQWFTWDDLGNCLIGSDLLLLRDGQHYIKLSENEFNHVFLKTDIIYFQFIIRADINIKKMNMDYLIIMEKFL